MTLFSFIRRKEDLVKALDCLDRLSMRPGYSMWLHLAEDVGMGDESYFCVRPDVMLENVDKYKIPLFNSHDEMDLMKGGVKVEPSPMGAWQFYLLISSTTVLPYNWHGGYNHRTYIFSYITLRKVIPPDMEVDDDFFTKHDLMPKITQQGSKFHVSCCYWSEWRGLVRETFYFRFKGHTITTIRHKEEEDEVILPYDCGICF